MVSELLKVSEVQNNNLNSANTTSSQSIKSGSAVIEFPEDIINRLETLGYTPEQIHGMSADEVSQILSSQETVPEIKIPGLYLEQQVPKTSGSSSQSNNEKVVTDTPSSNCSNIESTLAQYQKVHGNLDFTDENQIAGYFKFSHERYKNLDSGEQIRAFAADIEGFTDSLEKLPDGKKKEDAKALVWSRLNKIGVDEETIAAIKNGTCDEETLGRLENTIGKISAKINQLAEKNPNLYKDTAVFVAKTQAALLTQGYEPDENFRALHKNKNYTELISTEVRSIKGNKHIIEYMTGVTTEFDSELQVSETEKNMEYTYTFDNEADIIEAQRQIVDTTSQFAVENQAKIFEITMTSKFDAVQEYAASNIYKLDESVRDYAVELTKSLGKENVSKAIQTEAPPPFGRGKPYF